MIGQRQIAAIAAATIAVGGLAVVGLVNAQPADSVSEALRKGKADEEAPPASGAVPKKVTGDAAVAVNAPPVEVKLAPAAGGAPSPDAKAPPDRRPRFPVAIIQALDKVTAQSIRFEAPVNQPVRYGNLVITVRDCETTTADEPAEDAIAYVEVQSQAPNPSRQAPSLKTVFKGWMFADSPSVNPIQHPVYDAWLIACKA